MSIVMYPILIKPHKSFAKMIIIGSTALTTTCTLILW